MSGKLSVTIGSGGDELTAAIMQACGECTDENARALSKNVRETARVSKDAIKANARKKTGHYAKSWSVKVKESHLSTEAVVHSRDRYMLAHLLEKGHGVSNQYGPTGHTASGDGVIAAAFEKGAARLKG